MSVNLRDELEKLGLGPEAAVAAYPVHSLAALTVAFVEREGQEVRHDPLPDDPSHGLVLGDKPKSVRNRFAARSEWRVQR